MSITKLKNCVVAFARLVDSEIREDAIITRGKNILAELVSEDDWLPELFAKSSPGAYQQHLLYCDPLERFSIVSFVWGPGQRTPIHNHTVWGLIGMLRGQEKSRRYKQERDGQLVPMELTRLLPGEVDVVSPTLGDIHEVSNGLQDQPSISIHVYGANIGKVSRTVFDRETAAPKSFVSGYTNSETPNLWFGA